MAQLEIHGLSRNFGAVSAIRELSLTVGSGEFFILLGPSGCGKSTLLRLIAGLDEPDQGEILIGTGEASRRSQFAIAMVFQNYALYPHMSAFDNIAFPLMLKNQSRQEIERRVRATAELAGLRIDLSRRPAQLSGGERQRVALARALVREPDVILMDEPLSNLDPQLRASLRLELKDFQRRVRRTVVYVTHDQVEALTMADRLGVMRQGRLEQVGTPVEIYERPAKEFVASFIGQPPMNLLRCIVSEDRRSLITQGIQIAVAPPPGARSEVTLGIRPEDLTPAAGGESVTLEVNFERAEFVGGRYLVYYKFGTHVLVTETSTSLGTDSRQKLYAERAKLHFFDAASGERLE